MFCNVEYLSVLGSGVLLSGKLWRLLDSGFEGSTFVRNVGICLASPHGVTSRKTRFFSSTAVRAWDLSFWMLDVPSLCSQPSVTASWLTGGKILTLNEGCPRGLSDLRVLKSRALCSSFKNVCWEWPLTAWGQMYQESTPERATTGPRTVSGYSYIMTWCEERGLF